MSTPRTLYIVAPAAASPADLAATVDAYLDPQQAREIAASQAEHVDRTMTVHSVPIIVSYEAAIRERDETLRRLNQAQR